MKRLFFSIFVFFLILIPLQVKANDTSVLETTYAVNNVINGTCGTNVTWEYSTDTKTLIISGRGAMTNYTYGNKAPWSTFSNEMNKVTIEEGVETIGDCSFKDIRTIKEVDLPDSLKIIGSDSFYNCSGLSEISLPKDLETIGNNSFHSSGLRSVVIPDGVSYIGSNVFGYCSSLERASIPADSKTQYGGLIFEERLIDLTLTGSGEMKSFKNGAPWGNLLYQLQKVTIADGLTTVSDHAFEGFTKLEHAYIADSVEVVGDYAFYKCSKMNMEKLPNDLNSIGNYSFSECPQLTKITFFPTNLKSIGNRAFCKSYNFNCGNLPDGLETVGEAAFEHTGLRTVVIPNSVTTIGNEAFSNILNLNDITMPESVETCAVNIFYGCERVVSLSITGKGEMKSHSSESAPWRRLKDDIQTLKIENGITTIGDYAFEGFSKMTTVLISDSVSRIGKYSFNNCASLSTISLSDNIQNIGESAFSGCTALKRFIIPADVETVGSHAFSGCSSLSDITIAYGVKNIELAAFKDCVGLKSIVIPDSVTNIGAHILSGCYNIESLTMPQLAYADHTLARVFSGEIVMESTDKYEKLKSVKLTNADIIYKNAFKNWNHIENITFPDNITEIGDEAFYNCSSLKNNITISETVKKIGSNAFRNCKTLPNITISNGLESIGTAAFMDCKSFTSVSIPSSVTDIGAHLFSGCVNMEFLTMPQLAYTDHTLARTFSGEVYMESTDTYMKLKKVVLTDADAIYPNAFKNWNHIETIIIPDSVKSIGASAFSNCAALQSFDIPASVNSIGESAFEGCSSLTEIVIPKDITALSKYTFKNCSSLKGIVIPEGITELPDSILYGCSSLESIVLPKALKTINAYAMYGCRSLSEIELPHGLETIGYIALGNCSSLKEITIPGTVSAYTGEILKGDTSLQQVITPGFPKLSQVSDIRTFSAFFEYYGNSYDTQFPTASNYPNLKKVIITGSDAVPDGAFTGSIYLEDVIFSDEIKDFGTGVFRGCTSLKNVHFPAPLTVIPEDTFVNVGFTTFIIPEQFTSIDSQAFAYCRNLTSIIIPKNIINIGEGAFRSDTLLSEIYFEGNCPVIAPDAFSCVTATANVQTGTSGWTTSTMLDYGGSITWKLIDDEELKPQLKDFYLSSDFISLSVGEKYTITTTLNPQKCIIESYGWSISLSDGSTADNFIALSNTGSTATITAKSPCKAIITATLRDSFGNEITKNATVTVVSNDLINADITDGSQIMTALDSESSPSLWVLGLQDTYFFTGAPVEPAVSVYFGTTRLHYNKEYTISYAYNKAPGTGILIVTGKGNYVGKVELNYKIVSKAVGNTSIKKATVTGIEKTYPYNGESILPAIQISLGGKQLIQGEDYDIQCTKNIDVGTASVVITGIGNYSGTIKKSFKITPIDISQAYSRKQLQVDLPKETSFEKSGAKVDPIITCNTGEKVWTLRKGTDYKLTYSNNKKTGNGALLKIAGIGNYSKSFSVNYKISTADISEYTMCVSDVQYKKDKNGSYFMSKVSIYDPDGKVLKENSDYRLTYKTSSGKEITKNTAKNAISSGEMVIVLAEGIGPSYTGSIKENYTVIPSDQTVKSISKLKAQSIASQEYTGSEIEPDVRLNGATLNKDYYVAQYINNIEKGTATVILKGKGDYCGSKTVKFKIIAAKTESYWKGKWDGTNFSK